MSEAAALADHLLRGAAVALNVFVAVQFAGIRSVHLVIYLGGGTAAKGGSVRTVLYVGSALASVVLIGATGWRVLA